MKKDKTERFIEAWSSKRSQGKNKFIIVNSSIYLDSTSNNFKMALKSENISALAKFNFHPLGERKNTKTC